MNNPVTTDRLTRRGFSLIEMLVVLGVIGLIAGFAVPSITDALKGSTLTQAADLLTAQIATASETSTIENESISIEFYKYADSQIPGSTAEFRAFQLVKRSRDAGTGAEENEFESVSEFIRLPDGIIILDNPTYSTLVTSPFTRCSRTANIPERDGNTGATISASCHRFEFRPNGTTNLRKGKSQTIERSRTLWFLTLADEVTSRGNQLPDNFITLQVDPFTGSIRKLQP